MINSVLKVLISIILYIYQSTSYINITSNVHSTSNIINLPALLEEAYTWCHFD